MQNLVLCLCVHTISSYAIINLIFLKAFARHTHVEYTQIHINIVCTHTHVHVAYIHIYINTEHFSDLSHVTFVKVPYFGIYYLQVTFIHTIATLIGKNIN